MELQIADVRFQVALISFVTALVVALISHYLTMRVVKRQLKADITKDAASSLTNEFVKDTKELRKEYDALAIKSFSDPADKIMAFVDYYSQRMRPHYLLYRTVVKSSESDRLFAQILSDDDMTEAAAPEQIKLMSDLTDTFLQASEGHVSKIMIGE